MTCGDFDQKFSLFSFTLTTGCARVTATRASAVYRSARAGHGPEIKNHGDTANSRKTRERRKKKDESRRNNRKLPLCQEGWVRPIVCRIPPRRRMAFLTDHLFISLRRLNSLRSANGRRRDRKQTNKKMAKNAIISYLYLRYYTIPPCYG